jgi:hypothetical protein
MTPFESALWWVGHGLSVFPLIPRSKAPAISNGFLGATLDTNKVRLWWDKNPSYGVGVAVPDGIIVTDFDALAHEHLMDTVDMTLPDTFHTCTPGKGGGRHFWWRLPVGVVIPPRVKAMPGLDIRTKGSYVVSPPSEHPDGGLYQWGDLEALETFDPNLLPLCPAWVIEACVSQPGAPEGQKERVNLLSMLRGIEPGARQVGLFRAACSMRSRGFEAEEAYVILDGISKSSEGAGYGKWPDLSRLIKRVWKHYDGSNRVGTGKLWTLDELLSTDLGDVNWFVDDLLGPGLALVWADEKVGKSSAIACLAKDIATRERVWGKYVVPKARGVLYLDLEQDVMFGQRRWRKILDGRTPPSNLRVKFEWPRMDEGGMDEIEDILRMESDIDVVVIDVFSLFRPLGATEGNNAYDSDYKLLDTIKKKAKQYGVLFIVIHHTNKQGDASGSRAMKGAPDYLFEVRREPSSTMGTIDVNGKNIEARKLAMSVDLEAFTWKVVGVS